MRGARAVVLVISAVSVAILLPAILLPQLEAARRLPALHVALETAAPLVALLAGFLIFGRFLRRAHLTDMILACSLGALALSEVAFVTVPLLAEHVSPDLSVWAALGGRAFGAELFALAAFVPRRRLRRPRVAIAATAMAVIATLLLIGVLATSFAARLPTVPVAGPVRGIPARTDLHGDAALLTSEVTVAVIYALAAVGFLRRSWRFRDEFFGWLAIAAVFAAASHVNFLLYPGKHLPVVSLGDAFRLCFYAALLAGSGWEAWSSWRVSPTAAAMAERRRIACDLHDGLAQELAYLLRNLRSLEGTIDRQMAARLQQAAERAQLETRLVISTLAPYRQSVDAAITHTVGEIAARGDIRLELDFGSDIELPSPRAEALMRIACEAVGNAAHHSGAERVSLSLQRDGPHVRLRVRDGGSGFDPAVPVTGFGLISMRERASSVGGDLRISTGLGYGTEVEATL